MAIIDYFNVGILAEVELLILLMSRSDDYD